MHSKWFIDEHGRLGEDYVGIIILKLLSKHGDTQMIQKLVRWSIHKVFYDGVTMYDQGKWY